MSSDDERPAPCLKQGGGRGRTGGFEYLYNLNQEFAQPFENTPRVTMNTCKTPANSVFDAAVTTQILTKLKTTFADLYRPVHERLQKEEGDQQMSWNGVSDPIRRFVFGIYDRDKIPKYIVQAVQPEEIEHLNGKHSFKLPNNLLSSTIIALFRGVLMLIALLMRSLTH
jgi:flagellar biosynthesis protein FliP